MCSARPHEYASPVPRTLFFTEGLSRIVHRSRILKDSDVVPDDAVDLGEETQLDELGTGEGLDLSFLWVVDTRSLEVPSPRSSPGSSSISKKRKKRQSTSVTNDQKVRKIHDYLRSAFVWNLEENKFAPQYDVMGSTKNFGSPSFVFVVFVRFVVLLTSLSVRDK